MNEYFGEIKLNEPLTKEDWEIIADVDFKYISKVIFTTPHSGEVEFVKVVRCKDCVYWRHNDCQNDNHGYCPINEEDSCPWGNERKRQPNERTD